MGILGGFCRTDLAGDGPLLRASELCAVFNKGGRNEVCPHVLLFCRR